MIKLTLLLISSLLLSCVNDPDNDFKLQWNSFYKPSDRSNPYEIKKNNVTNLKLVSFSVSEMTITDFARHLSDKFEVGLIFEDKLSSRTITAEFKNNSIDQILTTVSKSFGVKYKQYKGLYYLGELDKDDQSILVRRVHRLNKEDIDTMVKSIISSDGSYSVTESGDVIISDFDDVLFRISETIDQINSASSNSWVVQFYFLNYRKSDLLNRGINLTASGDLAFKLIENSINPVDALPAPDGLVYNFSIDGLIDFAHKSDIINLLNNPLILLDDGAEGNWKDSLSVPIAKKTISPEGTVSTTGFEYTEVGSILKCKIRETSTGSVLTYSIEQSSINGFVENQAPIISQSLLSSQVSLKSSGVYLLGELTTSVKKNSVNGLLHKSNSNEDSIIQVFARLYHVK